MDRQIIELNKKYARKRALKRIVALLCVFVMLFTVNSLKMVAQTLSRVPMCGMKEHQHDKSCYDDGGALICGKQAHQHTDACYQEAPTTAADSVALVPDGESASDDAPLGLEAGEIQLGEEQAAPEAAPVAGEGDQTPAYRMGERALLSEIIAETGLKVKLKKVSDVGVVDYDGAQVDLLEINRTGDGDYAIRTLRDFARADLAIVLSGDVVMVTLTDGVAAAEEPVVEEEVVPTEEEIVPTEEEVVITEEEVAPIEEETIPTEEEVVPTEEETEPTEEEIVLTEEETVPTEEEVVLTEEETEPVEEEVVPTEEEVVPTEEEVASTEEEVVLTEEEVVLTEEEVVLTEEEIVPTEEEVVPTEEEVVPTEEETVPTEEETVSVEEESETVEEEVVLTEEETEPVEEEVVPTEEETAPTEEETVPVEEESETVEEEVIPTEEEVIPTEEESAPAEEAQGEAVWSAGSRVIEVNDAVVTLTWPEDAHVPDDVVITVNEIEKGTADYDFLYHQALDELPEPEQAVTQVMRFFDITLYAADGEKIEPDAPVSVVVTVNETIDSEVSALHCEEVGAPMEAVEANAEGESVAFDAPSFSVYGVNYTKPAEEAAVNNEVRVDLSGVDGMSAATVDGMSVTISIPELLAGTDDAVESTVDSAVDAAQFVADATVSSADIAVEDGRITLPAEALDKATVQLSVETRETDSDYVTTVTTHTVDIVLSDYAGRTEQATGEGVTVTALGDSSLPGDAVATVAENVAVPGSVEIAEGESAAAFDINLTNGNGDAITGPVAVTVMPTALNVLADVPEGAVATDIAYQLLHIHDDGTVENVALPSDAVVVDEDGKVESFSFETESFSTYVLKYTVDFEYTDPVTGETYKWSWEGRGSYPIADIMSQIGVEGEISDVSLVRTVDLGGAENALFLEQKEDGWYLTSEEAFADTFELTVVVDGDAYQFTVTDDNPIDLSSISNVVFSLKTYGNIERDATVDLGISFTLNQNVSHDDKNRSPWVIDLSAYCSDNPDDQDHTSKVFREIIGTTSGTLKDAGDATVGTYTIIDNVLRIYPKADFLTNTQISGNLIIHAQLNEDHTGMSTPEEVTWPGNSSTTITYVEKSMETTKKVGQNQYYQQEKTDGGAFEIVEQADGTYKLFYAATVKPNQKAYECLTMTDKLTGLQTLDQDSIQVKVGYGTAFTPVASAITNVTDKGFTIDIKAAIEAQGGTISKNTEYTVLYTATVDKSALNDLNSKLKNTAGFNYDNVTDSKYTEITTIFNKKVEIWKMAGPGLNNHGYGDGATFTVVQEGTNTDYSLWYETQAKPNTKDITTEFKMVDEYGADQTLDKTSIEVWDGTQWIAASNLASGVLSYDDANHKFTVNMLAQVGSNNIVANREYKVRYRTFVPEAAVTAGNAQISNKATWTWDSHNEEKTITVKPQAGTETYGITKKRDDASHDGEDTYAPGDKAYFTITVHGKDANGNNLDFRSRTITDYIDADFLDEAYLAELAAKQHLHIYKGNANDENYHWRSLDESGFGISISDPIAKDSTFGGNDGKEYRIITFTFPNDKAYTDDQYYIYYSVKFRTDVDPTITRIMTTRNKAVFGDKSVYVDTNVDFDAPDIEKEFVQWDTENNTAEWKIRVVVPAGKKLIQPIIRDTSHTGKIDNNATQHIPLIENYLTVNYVDYEGTVSQVPNSDYKAELKIDDDGNNYWKISFIKDVDNSASAYDKYIEVGVKTQCHAVLNDVNRYRAYNKATLRVRNDNYDEEYKADDFAYWYKQDFEFDKEGAFSQNENSRAKWSVKINENKTVLNEDIVPLFYDVIPDGMEFTGTMTIEMVSNGTVLNELGETVIESYRLEGYEPVVDGQTIGPVNLAAVMAAEVKKDKNPAEARRYPSGLSGIYYRVWYNTRIKSDKLQEILTNVDDYSFTNKATLYDNGGGKLKTDSETVKYEYKNLVEKKDISEDTTQMLKYSVDINMGADQINRGNDLILYDRISTDMTLDLDSIKIYKVTGSGSTETETEITTSTAEGEKCIISYEDDSRLLKLFLPDGKHLRVYFDATPRANNKEYINTVTLKGTTFSASDDVQKYHVVESSGTMTGTADSISITKFDEYDPSTKMPGVKFTINECKFDPATGVITSEEDSVVPGANEFYDNGKYTTNESGVLRFTGIAPRKVYRWVETDTLEDYELDGTKHYFVIYSVLNDANKAYVTFSKLSAETKLMLKAQFTEGTSYADLYSDNTDRILIAGGTPRSTPADIPEWVHQNGYYLNSYTAHSVTYTRKDGTTKSQNCSSLAEEVNFINQQECYDLDDWITAANKITVASVPDGYNWPFSNVKKDVTKVTLSASKKMIGADMADKEFSFGLYDATDPNNLVWLQTVKNTAANANTIATINFQPVTYKAVGTYNYVIREDVTDLDRENNVVYDTSVYNVQVVVTKEGNDLVAQTPVITKNGMPVSSALFVNKKDVTSLTINKDFGNLPEGIDPSKLKFVVHDQADGDNTENDQTITYQNILDGNNTITDLPQGHKFTVTEVDENDLTNYTATFSYKVNDGATNYSREATITLGETAGKVDFYNDYQDRTMDLVVMKVWRDTAGNVVEDNLLNPHRRIRFKVQKWNDGQNEWEDYNPDTKVAGTKVYEILANAEWQKRFFELPLGKYRVLECSNYGTPLNAENLGITYKVGHTAELATELGAEDGATEDNNRLWMMNSLAELTVHKNWKDKKGNALTDAQVEALNVASITYDIYYATTAEPNDSSKWTKFDTRTLVITAADSSATYQVPLWNIAGSQLYYRVVETSITYKDGTVLTGADLDYAYSCAIGSTEGGTEGYATPTVGEERMLYLTNREVNHALEVTKRWVKGNGTDVSDSVADDTVYFKLGYSYSADGSSNTWYLTALDGTNYTWGSIDDAHVYSITRDAVTKQWSTVTFDKLPRDPMGWGNGAKVHFFVIECAQNGTAISDGVRYAFLADGASTETAAGSQGTPIPYENAVGTLTIVNTANLIDISARKVWTDAEDVSDHPAITIRLFRDGVEVENSAQTIPANATGDALTVTWNDLPIKDAITGTAYDYSVQEDPVEGYVTTYSGTANRGFTVTNRPDSETPKADLTVTKAWTAGSTAKPVKVTLYRVETEPEGVTIDYWTYSGGKLIKSVLIPANVGDTISITLTSDIASFNVYDYNQISYSDITTGSCTFNYIVGSKNDRKTLYSNGIDFVGYDLEITGEIVVSGSSSSGTPDIVYEPSKTLKHNAVEALGGTAVPSYTNVQLGPDEWTTTFRNLPIQNGDGSKAYKYFVVEENGDVYSATYAQGTDNTITITNNNSDPQYTNLTLDKVWHSGSETPHKNKTGEVEFDLYQVKTVKTPVAIADEDAVHIKVDGVVDDVIGQKGKNIVLEYSVHVSNEDNFFASKYSALNTGVKCVAQGFQSGFGNVGIYDTGNLTPTEFTYNETSHVATIKYVIPAVQEGLTSEQESALKYVQVLYFGWQGETATLVSASLAEPATVDTVQAPVLYDTVTLTSPAWTTTLSNLPKVNADGTVSYKYYVVEREQEGVKSISYKVSTEAGGNNEETAVEGGIITVDNEVETGSLKLMKHVIKNGTNDTNGYTYFFKLYQLNDQGEPTQDPQYYIRLWVTGNHVDDYRVYTKDAYNTAVQNNNLTPEQTDDTTVNGVYFNHGSQYGGYAVIHNLPEGDYLLTEVPTSEPSAAIIVRGDGATDGVVDAANRSVKLHVTAGVDDPATDTAAVATFTNSYDITQVTVHKVWVDDQGDLTGTPTCNDADADAKFELQRKVGDNWVKVTNYANGTSIDSGDNPKTIHAGDNDWTYTWNNLPKYDGQNLIEYRVVENGFYYGTNSRVDYDVTESNGVYTVAKRNAGVTQEWVVTMKENSQTNTFTYTNTKTGALKLKKLVTVNNQPTNGTLADGPYTFKIHRSSDGATTTNDKTVVITITNGVAASATLDGNTVSLTDEYVVVGDLIPGDYVITENEVSGMTVSSITGGKNGTANTTNRSVTVTVEPGQTAPADQASATFTNDKENKGSLEIRKALLTGSEAFGANQEFKFIVWLGKLTHDDAHGDSVDWDGFDQESVLVNDVETEVGISGNYRYVTVTITGAGTATISNLPTGTIYLVVEETTEGWKLSSVVDDDTQTFYDIDIEGNAGSSTDGKGIIAASAIDHVTVTNYKLGALKLKKLVKVDGNELTLNNSGPVRGRTYHFTVVGPAGDASITRYVLAEAHGGEDEVATVFKYYASTTDHGYSAVDWYSADDPNKTTVEAPELTLGNLEPGQYTITEDWKDDIDDDMITTVSDGTTSSRARTITVNVTASATPSVEVTYTNDYVVGNLSLRKVATASTMNPINGDNAKAAGTYKFTLVGPVDGSNQPVAGAITKYVRIYASYDSTRKKLVYRYEMKDEDAGWNREAALSLVDNGGVYIDRLKTGDYLITETGWDLDTNTDGTVMHLDSISVSPEADGVLVALNTDDKTLKVHVDGEVDTEIKAVFTNELVPNTMTHRKMVLDVNDSSDTDPFNSSTEQTWEDSADYDIGDHIPYRVTGFLPQEAYRASESYYYRIDDVMQNLEYVDGSGHMFAFVKGPTDVEGHWYQVDEYFTIDAPSTMDADGAIAGDGNDAIKYLRVVTKETAGLKAIVRGYLTTWGEADTHKNDQKAEPEWAEDTTTIAPNNIQYLQLRYKAELMTTAKIGITGNANDAKVYYGNSANPQSTGWDRNRVFTYKILINKTYEKDDATRTESAAFALYKRYITHSEVAYSVGIGNSSGTTLYAENAADLPTVTAPATKVYPNDKMENPGNYYYVGETNADPEDNTFEWTGLDDGYYILVELSAPEGYIQMSVPIQFAIVAAHDQEADNPTLHLDGGTYVSIWPESMISNFISDTVTTRFNGGAITGNITNKPYLIDIKIEKVIADSSTPLDGAVFKLSKYLGMNGETENWQAVSGVKTSNTDEQGDPVVTGSDGQFTINGNITLKELKDGRYKLEEVSAPEGYIITSKTPVTFTILHGEVVSDNNVLTTGVTYKAKQDAVEAQGGEPAQEATPDTFTIPNTPGVVLPATGGMGTGAVYGVGAAMVLLALALLLRRKARD